MMIKELIDTLWNVNSNSYFFTSKNADELIDTLWNVNLLLLKYEDSEFIRINRYIMECKFICKGETNGTRKELIDTLWNVNLSQIVKGINMIWN